MENYSYNSSYPESGHSSPRSREIEFENPPPWEDSQGNQPPSNYKVKFMCSYGGKIHPRPHDNQLSYIGGETKILSAERNIKFAALLSKLVALCDSEAISFKYQLPGEDLDALISVTNDDDLEHMMHEYDRLSRVSPKPARLRIFIFPSQNSGLNSSRSFGSDEVKTEKDRFVEALNSAPIIAASQPAVAPAATTPAAGNVDFLFGVEKANAMAAAAAAPPAHMQAVGRVQELEDQVVIQAIDEKLIGSDPIQKHIHDLQRLRIEEQQQGIYRRKNDDNLPGGYNASEYYKVQEKISQVPAYWTEKPPPGGAFTANAINHEQQVYMIPAPAGHFQTPMIRPMAGAPTQGYYTIQRMHTEAYRDQQQIYNMIPQGTAVPSAAAPSPSLTPQKAPAVYSEAFGMVRPATTGIVSMVTEAGYAPMAYDGGAGRQVIYSTPAGTVIGSAAPVQAAPAQYQAVSAADVRVSGAVNVDTGGKVAPKPTQTSV